MFLDQFGKIILDYQSGLPNEGEIQAEADQKNFCRIMQDALRKLIK